MIIDTNKLRQAVHDLADSKTTENSSFDKLTKWEGFVLRNDELINRIETLAGTFNMKKNTIKINGKRYYRLNKEEK